ncbi:MAG: hypothetical protein KDB02_14165 [Acidimicrobiales bacterium]|nr:hypothetical protein [Acidimicrobiales bacterium]
MTTFSLDRSAVDRLRSRLGVDGPEPASSYEDVSDESHVPGWFEGHDLASRARSFRTRLLAPAERRVRLEVERAVARHDTELQQQVEDLRAELIRTRTAHAAELAALNEQLRGRP